MAEASTSNEQPPPLNCAIPPYSYGEFDIVDKFGRPIEMSPVDFVIRAVDTLRIHKMRPDKEHLFDILARYLPEEEDPELVLDQALAAGKIVQIFYKNTISYRNPDRVTYKVSEWMKL